MLVRCKVVRSSLAHLEVEAGAVSRYAMELVLFATAVPLTTYLHPYEIECYIHPEIADVWMVVVFYVPE